MKYMLFIPTLSFLVLACEMTADVGSEGLYLCGEGTTVSDGTCVADTENSLSANNNPEECEEICEVGGRCRGFHQASCLRLCAEDRTMRGEVLSGFAHCIEVSACDDTLDFTEASSLYSQCTSEIGVSVPPEAETWCSENYEETDACNSGLTIEGCKGLAHQMPLIAIKEFLSCGDEALSCEEKGRCFDATYRHLGSFWVFLDLNVYP